MMSNIDTYLMRIRPLDYYFLGSEQTFGGNDGRVNYLAKTLCIPQQTTLLGLLRHFFYDCADGISESRRIERIGKHGFKITHNHEDGFGYIASLSPVFFSTLEKQFWLPAPFLLNNTDGEFSDSTSPMSLAAVTNADAWTCTAAESNQVYRLPNYDEKSGISKDCWMNLTGEKKCITDLCSIITRIGINKQDRMREDGEDDEGFYKQELAILKEDLCFACLVKLKNNALPDIKAHKIMPFGGEKYLASVTIEKWEGDSFATMMKALPLAHPYPNEELQCYLLTSDALIYNSDFIQQQCAFVLGDTCSFRHIHTPSKAYTTGNQGGNFARFSTYRKYQEALKEHRKKRKGDNYKHDKMYKSQKYSLLKRGTLLYVKKNTEPSSIQDVFDHLPGMKTIGYNHFIEIDHKQHGI